LVSESYFGNAYPNILFDHTKERFKFQLTRRSQKNFSVDFGGVIATRDVSNIFLGLNYFHFGSRLLHGYAGFNSGNFYRAALIKMRMDFPFHFFLEPEINFNSLNYLANNDLLQEGGTTVLKRIDRKFGLKIGTPLGNSYKTYISAEGLSNTDQYSNSLTFNSTDTLDQLDLKGYKLGLFISTNNLNRKQYPSEGRSYSLSANYFNINESYEPGNTSVQEKLVKRPHQWLRLKISAEQYFNLGRYSIGYLTEGVLSNQPVFQNYMGTIINAPAFLPLQDSRTLLLQNFRAFSYIAGGIRNVIALQKRIDLRMEGYLFRPIDYLVQGELQKISKTNDLNKIFFTGTLGLVLHSPIGPVSLNMNYYDDNENELGVLLHVGFLLFNKHSIDQ
jgi:NTE family protein